MKKKLFLLFLLSYSGLMAQFNEESIINIKSPQSYAFEKFGNVPVNMYTGSIDLKIPITSIDAGDMNIPVFISYDSSGFIPHKKADIAGMNWSLITGGRITRKLNGRPDEYKSLWKSTQEGGAGWGYLIDCDGFLAGIKTHSPNNINVFNNINAFNLNGGTGISTNNFGFSAYPDWVFNTPSPNYYNSFETQPDVFSFNAVGISGKFVVGNDGNVLVESDDPNIKVDLSQMALYGYVGNCTPPVSIITITDGKGNKYVFGGDMSKYEINYPYTRGTSVVDTMPIINSFSLSKIILKSGAEIVFNYVESSPSFSSTFCVDGNLINTQNGLDGVLISMESQYYENKDYYNTNYNENLSWNNWSALSVSHTSSSGISDTFYSILKKSVLSSISYSGYEIKFNYKNLGFVIKHDPYYDQRNFPIGSNTEWVIDNIETYFNQNLIEKSNFLYTNYGGINQRPFLTSLNKLKGDQKYKFEYNSNYNLPTYYTLGIDHWGYWNFKDFNTSITPGIDGSYNIVTGDYDLINTPRDANASACNVMLLNKMIYPTKGYSEYEYEPQYYGKRIERNSDSFFLPALTNNSGLAGGARVKEVRNYTENGLLSSKKEYRYVTSLNGNISSGILMHWPRYHYAGKAVISGYSYYFDNVKNSNIQTNSLDSYNVGYSKVFEIETGKGYTEYNFTSYETNPDTFDTEVQNTKIYRTSTFTENDYSPFYLFKNIDLDGTDKSIMRGKILSEKTFKESDLTNPIKIVEFQYTDNVEFNPNSQLDNNNYVTINKVAVVHKDASFRVQGLKRYMNSSYLKKRITKDFYSGNEIKTELEYVYDAANHLNLSKESTLNSKNNLLKTNYYYPQDSQVSTLPYVVDLVTSNRIGTPLKTETFIGNDKIAEKITVFDKDPTTLLILTKNEYAAKFPNNITAITTPPVGKLENKITYDKYDNRGNILQYTPESGVPVSIIWGYNQTKPIAKIENATYSEVSSYVSDLQTKSNLDSDNCLDSQSCNEKNLRIALNNLRNDATYKDKWQVSTYTYNPLVGMTSMTDSKGYTTYYEYDEFNRLKQVKDANGKVLSKNLYHYRTQQ